MFTYLDSTISSLEEVFFPGITICNINNIKSSEFHEIGISHNDSVIETFFKFYVDVNTLATVYSHFVPISHYSSRASRQVRS